MATVLRNRFSYHRRLFLLLLAFSWALVACFVTFQYSREKRFKAERLDARLQLFNLRLLDALGEGTAPGAFLTGHPLPYGDLRVTVIDDDGRVLFDNSADSLPAANHLGRPEVTEAIAHGTGYTIHRHSESTDQYYFYSAMKGDGIIVRSAVPYSVSLREVLAADWEFLTKRPSPTTSWATSRTTSSASTPACNARRPTATGNMPWRCTKSRRKSVSRNNSPTTSTTS